MYIPTYKYHPIKTSYFYPLPLVIIMGGYNFLTAIVAKSNPHKVLLWKTKQHT
jgi:hypothetical protein